MTVTLFIYILVMALVTYLIRMLPFVVFRKKIESKFLKSFLYYVPYSVLGAMTIPGIFYATDSMITAAVGFVAASIAAMREKSLLVVALVSCVSAFAAGLIVQLL